MKKILILLLLISSTNVFAEWTEINKNTGIGIDGVRAYVDFGTVKKKGNKVTMWHLYDLETVHILEKLRYLSEAHRDEFDCEETTVRRLDFYLYDENVNKQGNVVYSQTNINSIISIVPNSFDELLLKIACDKK